MAHSQSTSKEKLALPLGTKGNMEIKREGGQNLAGDGPELQMTLGFRICGS